MQKCSATFHLFSFQGVFFLFSFCFLGCVRGGCLMFSNSVPLCTFQKRTLLNVQWMETLRRNESSFMFEAVWTRVMSQWRLKTTHLPLGICWINNCFHRYVMDFPLCLRKVLMCMQWAHYSFFPLVDDDAFVTWQVQYVCPLWVFLRSGLAVPQAVARKPLPQKVSALDSGIGMWRSAPWCSDEAVSISLVSTLRFICPIPCNLLKIFSWSKRHSTEF